MNTFGKIFKVTIYGASHDGQVGVVIDGVPSGIEFDEAKIVAHLNQRKPGKLGTTTRVETDEFFVTSGVFNGYTTGASIHIYVKNENKISQDYENLIKHPRPGHADFVAHHKYHGFNDHRGGGAFSGRITTALVIAGAVAKMCLPFEFSNKLIQVGNCQDMNNLDQYLQQVIEEKESVGGIVSIKVTGIPIGLGQHFFYKTESVLSQLLFAIPSVKGVSFGTIYRDYNLTGSQFNEPILNEKGHQEKNYAGGIHGGITNGNPLEIFCFIKPTPSIAKEQHTFNLEQQEVMPLVIKGRHDVAHIKRIGIVLESVVAIGLMDLYLINKAYQK